MKNHSLTYGQLHDKLTALGFVSRRVQIDGQLSRVYEHATIPRTMIVLPDSDGKDPVEPFYMNSVLATLRSRDLLPESNPLLT